MKNPRVSIIIPVYNVEDYIERSVVSLFEQTLEDMEFVFVDDCSPDKSIEILCKILLEYPQRKSQVKIIRHDYNKGVAAARNTGLKNATGEFIGWVDPDDWVESSMLEELYAQAKRNNADMVLCDFFVNTNDRQIYSKQQPSALDHSTVQLELFKHLHGSCCNKLIRRSCYSQYNVRFPEELSFCEDLYVNTSLLRYPIKISYLPKAFYHYDRIINSNSIVKSYSLQDFEYMEMLWQKFQELTTGERCYNACQDSMSALVVLRAFYGHFFDSRSFKHYCKFRVCSL